MLDREFVGHGMALLKQKFLVSCLRSYKCKLLEMDITFSLGRCC